MIVGLELIQEFVHNYFHIAIIIIIINFGAKLEQSIKTKVKAIVQALNRLLREINTRMSDEPITELTHLGYYENDAYL